MMEPSDEDVTEACVQAVREELSKAAEVIRHCMGQLTDAQLAWRPHESMNSVANLVLHLCGNLRQWIVSGVGGQPDIRQRAAEFAARGPFRSEELLRVLDQIVEQADVVLRGLTPSQILPSRRIQGFDTTGVAAILGSVAHFKGHTQEIVCLTRLQLRDQYRFDWVPTTPEQGALSASAPVPSKSDEKNEPN